MCGTYNSYHGSVDTPIDGVDTGYHSLKQFHEDRVQCVDTVPGSVNTRPSLQKTQLPDWDSVSTQPVAVSTLDPSPRRSFCVNGTMCRHTPWWCRHTPAETQKREFIWTRGCLGFKGICLGFCAHVP
ncbi:hypothetical protein Taro_047886 [Colocasia esculenta]|uniref:Uncharacterized protein n=1 Tax=Colocasia esculenta TaxID=4460 RepID=A0A843X819_COLES|nr:hypothetical protein [Colocasia esculenta]